MVFDIGLYLLSGVFSGLMSGILGIGGGVIIVPALLFIFSHNGAVNPEHAMQVAAGTSLAIMAFASQAAIRAHRKQSTILWPIYYRMVGGIIFGTMVGGMLASYIPTATLECLLGIFLLFIAFKLLVSKNKDLKPHFPAPWINHVISFFIGLNAGLLGIGGGALAVPYLNYCGIENRKITPISALCTLTVALVGTIVFITSGLNKAGMPDYSSGYVYWIAVLWVALPSIFFAPMGARLAYQLPVKFINYLFVAILLVTAINLIT